MHRLDPRPATLTAIDRSIASEGKNRRQIFAEAFEPVQASETFDYRKALITHLIDCQFHGFCFLGTQFQPGR